MKQSMWIEALERWPRWAVLGAILGLGILTRALLLIAWPELGNPNTMDTQNYLRVARSLVESESFEMWRKPTAYVAPGYPFFLAFIFKIAGENLLAVKLVQILLGAATTGVVYFLALQFVRPAVAMMAALITAAHPELVGMTSYIYTETLFIFLLTTTLLLLTRAMASAKTFYFLSAGALLGVTTLCRGTTLYFPVFLLGLALFSTQRRVWLRGCLLFVISMVIVIAPWTIRNYYHFQTFLPIATGAGDVFWAGNYLAFDGEYLYQETGAKMFEVAGDVDLVTRDRLLMEDAKKNILADPLPHAWLFVRKIFRYWLRVYEDVPHGEARQRNWPVFSVLAATHYMLLLLAVIGLRRCGGRPESVKMLLTFVCYYTLVHAATLAVVRYRMPLLPLISIASAIGLYWLWQEFITKEKKHGF